MGRGSSKAGGGAAGGSGTMLFSNVPTNATVMTDDEAQKIRDDVEDRYDASTKAAIKMYISNTDFDRQGHSMSQTLNYALDNGVDLQNATPSSVSQQLGVRLTPGDIASLQYTDGYMGRAMHDLGKDTMLQRGAHDDLLKNTFGIQDYSKLSDQQLQSRLVGQAFQTTSYMSTSYDVNKNPFLSKSSGVSGGREVVYNIKAGGKTQVVFGAKAQSEIVIGKGTNFKITGVRRTNNTVYPRQGGAKPQIVIDIETM